MQHNADKKGAGEIGLGLRWLRWMKAASVAAVGLALLVAVFRARSWPLVHDAPLMHYVVFLMEHGMAPYRDIVDQQMPGSYLVDAIVMHTLGSGARAWVCFDYLTGGVCLLACMEIAGRRRRWAGAMAGGLGYLYHLSGGAINLGERDWTVAVLLLVALGCTFRWARGGRAAWLAGALFCVAFASTIKPPSLLMAGVVAWCMMLQKGREDFNASVAWAALGGAIPLAALAGFLTYWQIWGVFFGPLRQLLVFYANQATSDELYLLQVAVAPWLMLLAAGAGLLFVRARRWMVWESKLLLAAVGVGFLLYFVQQKGWPYHGYSLMALLMLWVFLELEAAMSRGNVRYVAAVLVGCAVVYVPASLLVAQRNTFYDTRTIEHLQADLTSLGVQNEQGSVQCLDVTAGCLNVLLQMKRVQATGYMYDFYLFPEKDVDVTRALQETFLQKMEAAPPRLIVLTAMVWPGHYVGYDEVARWPAFARFLNSRYTLGPELATGYVWGGTGYRIYVRR